MAERYIPVKIGRGAQHFARGGLAQAAQDVSGAGRGGDDMIVHVNKREFDEMEKRWGTPTINPKTGQPEFFLGDLWDSIKGFIAPAAGAAAGAFLPGLGETASSYFPGLASMLGSTGMQAASSGLVGAGIGALTGGLPGAAMGALGGAGGAYGSAALNPTSADPVMGGGSGGSSGSGLSSALSNPGLLAGLISLGASAMRSDPAGDAAAQQAKQAQVEFNKPLPTYTQNRKRKYYSKAPDYTKQGERIYYDNNSLGPDGMTLNKADGGAIQHGGAPVSGRADNIPAQLSDGEYVIDAETVALLGDGSTQAGAEKLDQFRNNIRQQKGAALAQGKISPDALPAEAYLGGQK